MEYVVPDLSRIENVVISRTGIGGSIPDLVDNDSLRNLKELDTAFTDLSGSLPESLSVASDLVNLQLGGPRALWTGYVVESCNSFVMVGKNQKKSHMSISYPFLLFQVPCHLPRCSLPDWSLFRSRI